MSQSPHPAHVPRLGRSVRAKRRPLASLLLRITVALTAVGLVPLAIASLMLARINREGFSEQVLQTHSVAARTAAERVSAFLHTMETPVELLAGNSILLADPKSAAAGELLASLLETRPEIAAIAVLGPGGDLIIKAQHKELAYEVAGLLEAPQPEPIAVRRGDRRSWVSFDRALEGAGRLRLVANADALADAVESIEINAGDADLVLATTKGAVVAGTVSDLASFPAALLAAAKSGKISGSGSFRDAAGARVLGAYAPVDGADWFVASRQPQRLAEQIQVAMRRDSVVAVGLSAILVAALATVAHRSLVRPIRSLAQAQRRLAGFASEPSSANELDDLKQSFELLERRVRDSEEIGRVFLGRYQVIEQLGAGAMGTVFLGWDPKLERQVALKTVRLDAEKLGLARQDLSRSLRKEAVTAARFNHPNIVAVYDVESTKEVAFIAMEMVEGVGLEWLLWRQRPLSLARTAMLGYAIASALAAAHRQGVVHRDIKPSNVLLAYDGGIKVTDFGISEMVTAVTHPTETFFGTPGYVPPETLQGKGYNERGDLFALGTILYECLTGLQPFLRADLRGTMMATLDHDPEEIRALRPEAEPELAALIGALLAKAPEERPASAESVVRSLDVMIMKHGWRWDPAELPHRAEAETVESAHSHLFPTLSRRAVQG